MERRRTGRLSLGVGIVLVGLVFVWLPSARAAPAPIPSSLLQMAQKAEGDGDWETALYYYDAILLRDRNLADIKDRYLYCLRRLHLIQRHRDSTFRVHLQQLSPGKALELYEIVLTHLQKHYVEKERVHLVRLFQEGVKELTLALSEPTFLDAHVPPSKRGAVAGFEAVLRKRWSSASPSDTPRARALAADVAALARDQLGLKATVAVIEFVCGACNSLDEYSSYLPPSQMVAEDSSVESQLVGIGAQVQLRDGKLVISEVEPNSPAAQAGLRANDQIIRIDNRPTRRLSPEAARQLLRGEAGTVVEIEVVGPGDAAPRPPYKIMRQPSVVHVQMMESGLGYIRLVAFQKTTIRELEEAIEQLRKLGMKSLVLDLRGNPGGLFEVAVQVAERFLSHGRIVSVQGRTPQLTREYFSQTGSGYLDLPLVVLIDGDTASAAEVLAGALKENTTRDGQPRATLVGQTTFGKGSMQQVLELKLKLDELKTLPVGIRLTLAKLFSPLNNPYVGGITPHLPVERETRGLIPDRQTDRQLDMALNEAARLFALRQ